MTGRSSLVVLFGHPCLQIFHTFLFQRPRGFELVLVGHMAFIWRYLIVRRLVMFGIRGRERGGGSVYVAILLMYIVAG